MTINQWILINTLKLKQKDRTNTNFQYNKILKDEHCACLSLILLDSIVINKDKKCYPKIFLEECKYSVKEEKDNKYN